MILKVLLASLAAIITINLYWKHVEFSKSNTCGMTWMWRRIFLTPVAVDGYENSRYSLVHYSEGWPYDEDYVGGPDDVVVLFVPGSGGSGFQVRSLASVMINKTEMRVPGFKPHFYAVNFREELSFVSGRTVVRQRDFVVKAVETLKKRHKHSKLSKIVLFGHSFGGVVIRSLPNHPSFNSSDMELVITLASPLRRAPLVLDREMRKLYSQMRSTWNVHGGASLGHVGVLSYSGGEKDIQVSDWIANTTYVSHLPSWSVRRVDTSADHLCILWCNELVRHSSRLLYEYFLEKHLDSHLTARSVVDDFYHAELDRSKNSAVSVGKEITVSYLSQADNYNTIPEDGIVAYKFTLEAYAAVQFGLKWERKCKDFKMEARYPNELVALASITEGHKESSVLFLPQEHTGPATVVIKGSSGCKYSVTWKHDVFSTYYTVLIGFLDRTLFLLIASVFLSFIFTKEDDSPELMWLSETFVLCCCSCDFWWRTTLIQTLTVFLVRCNLRYVSDVLNTIVNRFSLWPMYSKWILLILAIAHPNLSFVYAVFYFSKNIRKPSGRVAMLITVAIALSVTFEGGPSQFFSYVMWKRPEMHAASYYYPFLAAVGLAHEFS